MPRLDEVILHVNNDERDHAGQVHSTTQRIKVRRRFARSKEVRWNYGIGRYYS